MCPLSRSPGKSPDPTDDIGPAPRRESDISRRTQQTDSVKYSTAAPVFQVHHPTSFRQKGNDLPDKRFVRNSTGISPPPVIGFSCGSGRRRKPPDRRQAASGRPRDLGRTRGDRRGWSIRRHAAPAARSRASGRAHDPAAPSREERSGLRKPYPIIRGEEKPRRPISYFSIPFSRCTSYQAFHPPSITRFVPLTKDAASEARKIAPPTTSLA